MIRIALQVIGTLIAVAGVFAVRMPNEFRGVIGWLEAGQRLRALAVLVAGLGALMAVGAGSTRWPMAIHVVGLAVLSVGIVSVAMGPRTLRSITTWWLEQGAFALRFGAWTLALFGVVVLVAAR